MSKLSIFGSLALATTLLFAGSVQAEPSLDTAQLSVMEKPAHLLELLLTNQCPGCDLVGVDLSREHLIGADLRGANLQNALLADINLEGADLTGANLEGADLTGANLSQTDLSNTNLDRADFSRATLVETDVAGAFVNNITLIGAKVVNTDISTGVGGDSPFLRTRFLPLR